MLIDHQALLVPLLLLSVALAPAQTITASLEGSVSDPTGALIQGARVRVIHAATNFATTLQTDSTGRFVAPALPAGPYSVFVEASGFKRFERTGIVLQVDQMARIELSMEIGS